MNYESTKTISSKLFSGVSFTIARMSFGRRLELAKRVREAGRAMEFLQAGTSAVDQIAAAVANGEIEKICLEWAFEGVSGLSIDGETPDLAKLISAGPEELTREIVDSIRNECGLSTEQRKN